MSQDASTLKLTITGAAGQIAYALLPRLGELLINVESKIDLRLCDTESQLPALHALSMELDDFACPWIEKITCTSNLKDAFEGCELAILIGARPRTLGMERSDLLVANGEIFSEQGRALNAYADQNVKVLVVANPCNTNAYICMNHAKDIPSHRFFSMSMLDQNRAYAFMAKQYDLELAMIENLCVWGNHSPSMYVDFQRATYDGQPIIERIQDHSWFANDYQTLVAQRGSEVIKARGSSSAASAANAIIDNVALLLDQNQCYGNFSMGVCSHGEYGAQPGTIVSYPCVYNAKGELSIVEHIDLDPIAQQRIALSFEEIANEANQCRSLDLITH